jgi:ribosomal protein S18 acetylase RimI-like enzyme
MTNQLEKPQHQLTFDMTVSDARAAYLEDQIVEFNRTHFELWAQNHDTQYQAELLHIFALDPDGEVVGGLTGRTHDLRAWLEISMIWVKAAQRRQGIGRAMMAQAEAEAWRRGCLYARLATSHFQAPGFYEKLGYTLYGKLENCPPGDTCFYYRKDMGPTE